MFFNDWYGLVRVIVTGTLAYAVLVLVLRLSGKRTLSKMNAFDLVVTVALGSTLATILLSRDVALAEGVAALGLLIGLQFLITWSAVRSGRVARWIKSDPALLYFGGRFLEESLRQERVTQAEVRAAVRAQGLPDLESVGAVVLETDGSMTVLPCQPGGEMRILRSVSGPGQDLG